MIKVSEIRGFIFSATLSDNSTLCLQAGESANIDESLVSEPLKVACSKGIVIMSEIAPNKTKEKTGGVSK